MTRFTSFNVGDLVHCIKRGAFGNIIFREESDYWRFVRLLYLCNDEFQDTNLNKAEKTLQLFERPPHWPERKPLVDIVSWVAMPNHFHILVHEKIENGISKYMRKLLTGYSMYFNKKYERTGKLYEGVFKSTYASSDRYLKYLYSYVHLNPIKLIQKNWKEERIKDKDEALEYLNRYKYSSYLDYVGENRVEKTLNNIDVAYFR